MTKGPTIKTSGERIVSIDVLRGLTILVMIFVNDVAGVKGAPGWMKHFYPYEADGMTFVDVVFPAFLFIVGMAIPFAIGRRMDRGVPIGIIWRHILIRTVGLLIIGVFMVNSYTISDQGVLHKDLWIFLMYLAVIMVWNQPPKEPGKKRRIALSFRASGVALLLVLAILYRGKGDPAFIELRTQWWGILGLIGWAYLVSCMTYTFLRKNMAGLMGMAALLYCMYMADRAGLFEGVWLDEWVDFGSMLGSHAAITVSGVILGNILTRDSPVKTHWARIRWAMFYGLGMIVAGHFLHSLSDLDPMFIINKNAATPPWCLISSGITVWVWALTYWLLDVKGWKTWIIILRPAGENPLFAYILQPMVYSGFSLLAIVMGGFDFYASLGQSFAVGFWRSLIFAFGVTWLTGAFKKLGVRLRL